MAKDRTFNGEVRAILSDAAKEMGFAVDSIRNEVIDKAWFDRKNLTPEVADKWAREDYEPQGMEGPQDFSHNQLNDPNADWDNMRDVMQETNRNPSKEERWQTHKEEAEQLYGRDHDEDRGMDI